MVELVKAATVVQAAAAEPAKVEEKVLPESLKRFADGTGSLDVEKLAHSMSELEKFAYQTSREKEALSKSYEILAQVVQDQAGKKAAASGVDANGRSPLDDMVDNPAEFARNAARSEIRTVASPIVETVLSLSHPELALDELGRPKDPQFRAGLKEFGKTLPPQIQQSLADGDFQTTKWAIQQYKLHLASKAPQEAEKAENTGHATMPFTMPVSGGTKIGGQKVWSRAEIRQLAKKPAEYARYAGEIGKAYKEGRVSD